MTAFVFATVALTLLAIGAVVLGPRRQRPASAVSQVRINAAVLSQQLAELEGERARGQIDEAEFERLRDELQRRLLAETSPVATAAGGRRQPRRVLRIYAAAMPVAAFLLYQQFGQAQLIDASATPAPRADGGAATHVGDQLLARLQAHVAATPGDARAWVMLARARMQRDQFEPAAFAYQRALDASAKVARDPLIWCEYADSLGMAQGGKLAGRPRELVDKALALDGAHPRALEMAGSAAYEAGDFRAAARYWQQLLTLLPAQSAEHVELAAAITRAEQRAKYRLPAS